MENMSVFITIGKEGVKVSTEGLTSIETISMLEIAKMTVIEQISNIEDLEKEGVDIIEEL